MKSWKTNIGGIISLLGGAFMAAPDNAPGAAYVKPWGPAMIGLGAGITGLFARDNNVTSEDVGVAKPKILTSTTQTHETITAPITPPVPPATP